MYIYLPTFSGHKFPAPKNKQINPVFKTKAMHLYYYLT